MVFVLRRLDVIDEMAKEVVVALVVVEVPKTALLLKRFVELAVVANKLVVVAFVVVEFPVIVTSLGNT